MPTQNAATVLKPLVSNPHSTLFTHVTVWLTSLPRCQYSPLPLLKIHHTPMGIFRGVRRGEGREVEGNIFHVHLTTFEEKKFHGNIQSATFFFFGWRDTACFGIEDPNLNWLASESGLQKSLQSFTCMRLPCIKIQKKIKSVQIYMKDAGCAETNEKSILAIFRIEIWSILYLKSANFRCIFST